MLAASLSGTVLKITGTGGDDEITITRGSSISVNINGETTKFKASKVNTIKVNGGDGHDEIRLGSGATVVTLRTTITGGEGNDTIFGGSGADSIKGQDGADSIRGGGGDDSLGGGSGNDRILGQNGNDFVGGDADDDTISGGKGDDQLYGGADDDTVIGDAGNDTLGGDGEDRLNFWNSPYATPFGGDDQLDGGDGNDWLLGSIETNEEQYDDDSAAKLMQTGNGRDTMTGGAGNDVIDARGNDTVTDEQNGDRIPEETYHNNGIPIPDVEEGEDPYALHTHIVLRVFVDGKKVEFPVGTGEFGVTMIHRHYSNEEDPEVGQDDNKDSWHLHALEEHTFTLKEIFEVAGVSFSAKNIGRHRVGNGATMTMRVKFLDEPNSAFQNVTTFGNHVIRATDVDGSHRQEVIEIRYTSN